MNITLNPITGGFDEVEIPLKYDTSDPALASDGDMAITFKNGNAYLYWKTNGQVFYRQAIQG